MRVTPLMWKSLDAFATSNHFCTYPTEWSPTRGIFVYNPISRKLTSWGVALYFLCLPYTSLILLMSLSPLFGTNKLPGPDYILNSFWLAMTLNFLLGETVYLIFGQDFGTAINSLLVLVKSWEKSKIF